MFVQNVASRASTVWLTSVSSYAVSYVTTSGEGFLSSWSEPMRVRANGSYVKVSL